jgi:hypothetical protein
VGKITCLIDGIHQERYRAVRGAALDAKDLTDRRQIEGISPEAIESVRGKGHNLATQNEVDGVFQNVFE